MKQSTHKTGLPPFRDWQDKSILPEIIRVLQAGKVIISETDTVLGFLSTVTAQGYYALNRIKKRAEKPYLILINNINQLDEYIQIPLNPAAQRLVNRYWPGPLTIIFNAKSELPDYAKSSDGTVALRMPNDPHMQALLEQTGPLFSTSANLSGKPIPNSVEELDPILIDQVLHVVYDSHKTSENNNALPSTIVDCTQGDEINIVRQGGLKISLK